MIPESEVQAMLERANAATPGPWDTEFPEGRDCQWLDVVAGERGEEVMSAETQPRLHIVHANEAMNVKREIDQHKANLEFVAHARTDLPRLAEALLAERERCAKLCEEAVGIDESVDRYMISLAEAIRSGK